ncbi:MAG TPA: hypothetical protein VMS00_01655 [Acidimicrobiales bacterium]|nr:hypothetical protein [Acidimicrobiales bacterium]
MPPAAIAGEASTAPSAKEASSALIAGRIGDQADAPAELRISGSYSPEDAVSVPGRRGRAGRRELLVVVPLSFVLAAALWHNAWVNPFATQLGGLGDADEYGWFLAWMPYALGHGLDPLISHYANFPSGVNLMWNTSVVLPSFVMSPVTVIFGAAFSYNILMTAAPALSATFAFVAFRRWTAPLPSLAGALIFGFSPYVISQSFGHVAQTLILSVPLMLIALDRLLVLQAKTPWRDGLLLGLLAWAQLLTGEEVLAMEAVTAAIAVAVLGALNWSAVVSHMRYAGRGLLTAAGTFLVLSAPFLGVQYLGPDRVQNAHPYDVYVSDLFNFFVPTDITKLAPTANVPLFNWKISALAVSSHFTGNGSEQSAYIGVPLLVFMALAIFLARRRGVTWTALAVVVGAGVLSMGPTLHVVGDITSFRLPGDILHHLPVLQNLLPDRFAGTMFLGVGLLVALGLDELKRLAVPYKVIGWALVGLGLASLFPTTDFPAATSPLYTAFDTGLACPSPTPGSGHPPVALLLPAVNELNLRWQPESKFCFVMPSDTGMTGTNQGDVGALGLMLSLAQPGALLPPLTPATRADAANEITALDVKEIVVGPESPQVPTWSPDGQAQLVVWLEWLLGQAPVQSRDNYISYIWKDLPPASDIASGKVGTVPGEA